MKIEIICKKEGEEDVIYEQSSMYAAHTTRQFVEAHGYTATIIKDGEEVNNLSGELQHPSKYK